MPATDSAAGARNGEDRISETDAAFGRQSADRQGRRRRVRAGLYRRDAGLEKRCRAPPRRADHAHRSRCAEGGPMELALLRGRGPRSEEHTSELQSLMRISYAVFCLKKKK